MQAIFFEFGCFSNMKSGLLLILIVCLFHITCMAQSTGPDVPSKNTDNKYASSVDPARVYQKAGDSGTASASLRTNRKKNKRTRKGSFAWQLEQKQKEYRQRMIANAKKHTKEARLMQKPQYADPTYFGHKRKPKKRPAGKRRLCKECGIVH